MKKGVLYIVLLISSVGLFSGCIKNGTDRTITPSMVATVGTTTFNAISVQPATVKPQLNDSATTLIITGYDNTTGDKLALSITSFKGKEGTFSIVQGQAFGTYMHGGVTELATGGIVSVKDVLSSTIDGYFNFTTASGINITNGTFTVGNPWNY